jgi:carbamate kinase
VTTVVALGGNALIGPGERGTAAEQLGNLRATARSLGAVLRAGERVVITHGNGPQVGNELLRQERAAAEAPQLPLWLAVAQTQAEIGALIEAAFPPPVACVLTHVRVDPDDPAFTRPTKPIGPFYSQERAEELERERGWQLVQDSGRGWRRVVPSPAPLEVVELASVRALLESGTTVVACGGGGIPVADGAGLRGLDAVIDKDRASALLAAALPAERLLILTAVPAVARAFGTPEQEEIAELSVAQAEALVPELAEGSMGPKVQAAAAFVRATGGEAVITSAEKLGDALAGGAGTRIRA